MDNTQLKRLPSRQGIKSLKRLSIKNVTSLLTLPDAKIFENINRVDVTYSMQCCAFQKVSLERESKFNASKIQSSKEESKKNCTGDINGEIGSMEMDKGLASDNDTTSEFGLDHGSTGFKDIMHKYMNAIFGPEPGQEDSINTNISLCDYGETESQSVTIKCNPEPELPCPNEKGNQKG